MPDRAEREHEPFSNPLPPSEISRNEDHPSHPMTNEDFRKLLMTPRAPALTPAPVTTEEVKTHAATKKQDSDSDDESGTADERAERRKRKKKYYASLNKQQEDKLAELSQKYRDRAKERRDGANPDYQNEDPITSAAGYRAVAPDAKSGLDAAERRRQMIQESKFLGGDMEHTHLVKGLDYALLQKVRSEITYKEKEDEELESQRIKHKDKDEEEEIHFRTKLGKNIYRQVFRHRYCERSELFLPNRMAYIIDLEDEFAESDIPTTLLRSKADCPSFESQTTLTTNDIVIKKLTQILSYLRQGIHNKRGKRKDKGKLKEEEIKRPKLADDSIFGDIGDYVPTLEKKDKTDKNPSEPEKRKSYFEKPRTDDERRREEKQRDAKNEWDSVLSGDYENADHSKDRLLMSVLKGDDSRLKAKLTSKLERDVPESYAECYPGAPENEDAVADSDDEVDYSKMDMGNKKGPIGRWDFDTAEEYSDYMSHKEALPKAAFQYGVKMADGRKTRRTGTGKRDEKTKLDRELQKINQIIARKKDTGSFSTGVGTPEYKRPRY
ncbi:protein Red [Parasteatoda tepidariorum]|uniref:protein Red n=1 Tax=Parasteatoda tepidariorum TaxID=114398 RepID=UPI00077FB158|nr:protein Red [Parasteatoda tepidariorum]